MSASRTHAVCIRTYEHQTRTAHKTKSSNYTQSNRKHNTFYAFYIIAEERKRKLRICTQTHTALSIKRTHANRWKWGASETYTKGELKRFAESTIRNRKKNNTYLHYVRLHNIIHEGIMCFSEIAFLSFTSVQCNVFMCAGIDAKWVRVTHPMCDIFAGATSWYTIFDERAQPQHEYFTNSTRCVRAFSTKLRA